MASQNGVTELRSDRSGRDLNTPTSRQRRALLPVTVPAPARSRDPSNLLRSWSYSPQPAIRRGHEMRSGCGVEPQAKRPHARDNRAAPARDDPVLEAGLPGVEPGPARLELAVLPFTPQARAKRTTRIERASPEWRPGALPSELRPRSGTPGWTRTSGLCRRRTALSPLSYGRMKEPPAGVEPAPRPYKGRVLAVDTTEARLKSTVRATLCVVHTNKTVETVGVEPTSSSLQARRSPG
jgi:hypothetical protein